MNADALNSLITRYNRRAGILKQTILPPCSFAEHPRAADLHTLYAALRNMANVFCDPVSPVTLQELYSRSAHRWDTGSLSDITGRLEAGETAVLLGTYASGIKKLVTYLAPPPSIYASLCELDSWVTGANALLDRCTVVPQDYLEDARPSEHVSLTRTDTLEWSLQNGVWVHGDTTCTSYADMISATEYGGTWTQGTSLIDPQAHMFITAYGYNLDTWKLEQLGLSLEHHYTRTGFSLYGANYQIHHTVSDCTNTSGTSPALFSCNPPGWEQDLTYASQNNELYITSIRTSEVLLNNYTYGTVYGSDNLPDLSPYADWLTSWESAGVASQGGYSMQVGIGYRVGGDFPTIITVDLSPLLGDD